MILTYTDKHTHLQTVIETDDIYYIAYHADMKRAVIYLSNGFKAFSTELSTLLLPITNEDLSNLVYTLTEQGTHYLINFLKVKEFKASDNEKVTLVLFNNSINLEVSNSYLFHALQRTQKLYEDKNSKSFCFCSTSDS